MHDSVSDLGRRIGAIDIRTLACFPRVVVDPILAPPAERELIDSGEGVTPSSVSANRAAAGLQLPLLPDLAIPAARPFLKWAGGKQQLLSKLISKCPSSFNAYYEPFLGSGALFFALAPRRAVLSDANEELIVTFQAVRDQVHEVIRHLRRHRNGKEHFLAVRRQNPLTMSAPGRAARLIFLNRTCYNGLYRVNQSGQFNTPFGRYKRPNICNRAALQQASVSLGGAEILALDFRAALERPTSGDFVYLDPPYVPVGRYSDFKRYHKEFFSLDEHRALAVAFAELHERGCHLMLSNSYCEITLKLFDRWNIEVVHARRLINKNSNGRSPIREILVTNY